MSNSFKKTHTLKSLHHSYTKHFKCNLVSGKKYGLFNKIMVKL